MLASYILLPIFVVFTPPLFHISGWWHFDEVLFTSVSGAVCLGSKVETDQVSSYSLAPVRELQAAHKVETFVFGQWAIQVFNRIVGQSSQLAD